MKNEYIEKYKNLICPNIEKYLVPTLNNTRETPTWFIGYLTEWIDDISVNEHTHSITKAQADLYLNKQFDRLYKLVDSYSHSNLVYNWVKYNCVVYIIIEGLDKFKSSVFYEIITSPLYYQFMSYTFHIEFDKWLKTKIKRRSVFSQMKELFK